VLKNESQAIIGGLLAYTTLKAVHTVCLWIDENYRNLGYGRQLLRTAERIAIENGCISGLVNVLSFQSPEFFRKGGYTTFGVSDGYPDSIKEYFLMKGF
jgi:ribosomal protein S18 acetylase RimI-like enzyme